MKDICIIEKNESCCGDGPSTPLVSFLKRRLHGSAQVRVVDFQKDRSEVRLATRLCSRELGESDLPVFLVDGIAVKTGKLPNFMEAVELIDAPVAAIQ